jgi:uncharacterized protein (UPF0332 family)
MATYQTVTAEDKIEVAPYVARARESLRAAAVLRDAGFHADAVSRAHQACVHGERALLATEKRSPPDVCGVHRMASNHFLQPVASLNAHLAALDRLAALRSRADDLPDARLTHDDACEAVAVAESFLAATDAWLRANGFEEASR